MIHNHPVTQFFMFSGMLESFNLEFPCLRFDFGIVFGNDWCLFDFMSSEGFTTMTSEPLGTKTHLPLVWRTPSCTYYVRFLTVFSSLNFLLVFAMWRISYTLLHHRRVTRNSANAISPSFGISSLLHPDAQNTTLHLPALLPTRVPLMLRSCM